MGLLIGTLRPESITGTNLQRGDGLGNLVGAEPDIEYLTPVGGVVKDSSTGSAKIPTGTTAERGVGEEGKIRGNSTVGKFEGYINGQWGSIGGGAGGGGSDSIFHENDQYVTTDYAIPVGKNAGTFGPIQINPGVVVTISPNSVWSIV